MTKETEGIIIPVIPTLIEQLTGEVSGQAAMYGMWLLIAFAGIQFLFSPVMSELSDRYGRRPLNLEKMVPGKAVIRIVSFAGVGGLILAFFLANMAGQSLPAIWSFCTKEVLDWSEAEIGYSLSFVGILVSVTQALLIGKYVKWIGAQRTIQFGFVLWTIGMTLFAFASDSLTLYLFCIPYCLGGMAGPTLQSILSDSVSDTEQGILQGSLTSLTCITTILGPVLASTLFYRFTESEPYFPGAPYLAGGILLSISAVIVFITFRRSLA